MERWQIAREGLEALCLVALILVSCTALGSDDLQEGCDGVEAVVSCLQITNIVPVAASTPTSNVDVHQDICVDPATGKVTVTETFTGDHAAQVTFANQKFPTASAGFDIRILGFSVSYRLNQCPMLARSCPPLTDFTVSGLSLMIPLDGTVTQTFPFVPLRVKQDYVVSGGEVFSGFYPSYTAVYTFTAQAVSFNDTFTVSGGAEFTIGDFLTHGFTCQGIIE